MKSVERFAFEHCTVEQATQISNALRYGTCPKILEFATVTLLAAGKSVNEVRRYLRDKGYDTMLTEATRVEQHYESRFMALWGKSPQMCLRYYALRKRGGGVLRKLRLRK